MLKLGEKFVHCHWDFNPSQTLFWWKEPNLFDQTNNFAKIYKFNLLMKKMLYKIFSIVCVLHKT